MKHIKCLFSRLSGILVRNYRHCICAALLSGSVALTFLRYFDCLRRIGEAFGNLGRSLACYGCFLIGRESPFTATVLQTQKVNLSHYVPFDTAELVRKLEILPKAFFSDLFLDYFAGVLELLISFLRIATVAVPALILVWIAVRNKICQPNTDHGKDSKPLLLWLRTTHRAGVAVKGWCGRSWDWLTAHGAWWKLFLLVWAVNLNLIGIIIDALAFYFWFASTISFGALFATQPLKLFIDLILMFSALPFPLWLIIGAVLIDLWRKSVGYRVLEAHEAENRDFLMNCPLVMFLVGTMGSKKTTHMTDFALSFDILFRDKALEMLLEIDLEFPTFPWIALEQDLLHAMSRHRVYSLASCRNYIAKKEKTFRKTPTPENIYGYNCAASPMTYNNGLEVLGIWKDLSDYACLYFIYCIQSSLLISNYSVRVDTVMQYAGNFPLWDNDLFRRDPRTLDAVSRHAHILDFDVLRVSRQLLEDNKLSGSLEFGVVLITEIDKERGNRLKLEGLKKAYDETNQKNDNFNYSLKMGRHPATVRNFPFIRFIVDAQRPESWEADGRELTTELRISDCSPKRLAMPLFIFFEILHDWIVPKFCEWYPTYRYSCGDNKLTVRFLHWVASAFSRHYNRIYNIFGYMESSLTVIDGREEEAAESHRYFLAHKKIYSRRFATDCYREFFAERSRKSGKGIEDYPTYKTVCASPKELHQQNSYFIAEMENLSDDWEKL